jgi:2-hydroxychromene-2-carboxylate isomerase
MTALQTPPADAPVIEYFLAPQSPWTYLGHARLYALAQLYGAIIKIKPMDLGGKVFPVSGGLPLAQRPVQRQAYRLVELPRWAQYLGLPLHLKPQFFPVAADDAARMIIRVDTDYGVDAAMRFAHFVMAGVWAQQENIADGATLHRMLVQAGLTEDQATRIQTSANEAQSLYELYTQQAIDAQVFGAPWYRIEGENFWGQDRLDFVERKLAALTGKVAPAQ